MNDNPRQSRTKRFLHSPLAVVSAAMVLAMALGATFAPWIAAQNPYDLATLNLRDGRTPPLWLPGGKPPYLLDTDDQGRDILSTILYGLRISFIVGVASVALSALVGIAAGVWAGFRGG